MNTVSCIPERPDRQEEEIVKKKWKYISVRFQIQILTLWLLCLLLLITLAAFGGNGGRKAAWLFSGLLFLGTYAGYRYIYLPLSETKRVERQFAAGYVFDDLFEIRYHYDPETEGVQNRFQELLDTRELINVSKKQAEYLALQNQINPHFLYNTLEGIRSEALIAGVDSIAEMTEALATFFRYTISRVEHLVTLEDELANIENYYYIQQFRFGDKLTLSIQYDLADMEETEILQCRLPKLTLQPIVENSIYHGIERKIGKGSLTIRISATVNRLMIRISDDGLGMEADVLSGLNERLKSLSLDDVNPRTDQKGGIAVLNVNNRIKLLFGEEYGIYIYSQPGAGTDVEVTLPLERG